jgi:hypothetical protein
MNLTSIPSNVHFSTKVLPYVYLLIHKITGEFYIGYRETNQIPSSGDLGEKYKSSSKKIKAMGFNNFRSIIIAEFFTGNDAYEFENRLIEEHIKDPLCLNGTYIKDGKLKFSFAGKTRSVETRAKMSKYQRNKIVSKETKEKMRIIALNRPSPSIETRKKISLAGIGRKIVPRSNEWKIKQRASHLGRKDAPEIFKKKSLAQSGAANGNAKLWTIQKEVDLSIFKIKALKPWCKNQGFNADTLKGNSAKGNFYKGFKVLSEEGS